MKYRLLQKGEIIKPTDLVTSCSNAQMERFKIPHYKNGLPVTHSKAFKAFINNIEQSGFIPINETWIPKNLKYDGLKAVYLDPYHSYPTWGIIVRPLS